MQEYLDDGLRLGWLVDPSERCVFTYRSGRPGHFSGASILPNFEFNLDPT